MKIEDKNWELYIARPFSVFGASLWNEWYISNQCQQIAGANNKNCLMIEYPKGVVRYYWNKNEQKKLLLAFNNLVLNKRDKLEKLLRRGLLLNKRAASVIKKNDFKDFKLAVDFLIELALLCTILPFRSGNVLTETAKDKKILGLAKKIRTVSHYEKVINKVVLPLAFKELKSKGLKDKEQVNFFTLNEILSQKNINLQKRISDSNEGKFFVYQNFNGLEKISWIKDPTKIIKKIEGGIEGNNVATEIIKGNTACGGRAKGIVRLVLTNEIKSLAFNKGDILVSISTSPELMPLIKKCGAIVTDEGGLTCHAAIISRELKIPCVIGTKIATQVLRNGDMVEVDAGKGTIKIIKKAL